MVIHSTGAWLAGPVGTYTGALEEEEEKDKYR